jgi:hypothetical protein
MRPTNLAGGRGGMMDKYGNFSWGAQLITVAPLVVLGLLMAAFL